MALIKRKDKVTPTSPGAPMPGSPEWWAEYNRRARERIAAEQAAAAAAMHEPTPRPVTKKPPAKPPVIPVAVPTPAPVETLAAIKHAQTTPSSPMGAILSPGFPGTLIGPAALTAAPAVARAGPSGRYAAALLLALGAATAYTQRKELQEATRQLQSILRPAPSPVTSTFPRELVRDQGIPPFDVEGLRSPGLETMPLQPAATALTETFPLEPQDARKLVNRATAVAKAIGDVRTSAGKLSPRVQRDLENALEKGALSQKVLGDIEAAVARGEMPGTSETVVADLRRAVLAYEKKLKLLEAAKRSLVKSSGTAGTPQSSQLPLAVATAAIDAIAHGADPATVLRAGTDAARKTGIADETELKRGLKELPKTQEKPQEKPQVGEEPWRYPQITTVPKPIERPTVPSEVAIPRPVPRTIPRTAARTAAQTRADLAASTRTATTTASRSAARTLAPSTVATATATGAPAAPAGAPFARRRPPISGFKIPGGRTLPPGVFPRVVRWPQGISEITLDLRSGSKSFRRRLAALHMTPSEGFRVIAFSRTPPRPQRFHLGVVTVTVTTTGLSFAGRRKSRASKLMKVFA